MCLCCFLLFLFCFVCIFLKNLDFYSKWPWKKLEKIRAKSETLSEASLDGWLSITCGLHRTVAKRFQNHEKIRETTYLPIVQTGPSTRACPFLVIVVCQERRAFRPREQVEIRPRPSKLRDLWRHFRHTKMYFLFFSSKKTQNLVYRHFNVNRSYNLVYLYAN